jgi:LuxR family maltose regulon positive regulatory protein
MHVTIATREDPSLPLARLRARGQLTELRATDLRFSSSETAAFLNQVMGLDLSEEDIGALERRTEGWIAGLQLATISMQGRKDVTGFIQSFAGSHHYVLDYLVEEVLDQQSESVQAFLLQTSILDRLCGALCDALTGREDGQTTLEMLEHANLFIVPLDNERRWYRYHHLFADLLRQRLHQSAASSTGHEVRSVAEYYIRASQWYEVNGLGLEAFHYAAAANDVDRAARLMEGGGMPLHFRGAVAPVLNWLQSLPAVELNVRPSLWVMYASALSMTGQTAGVEEKLQAAEAALAAAAPQDAEPDEKTRNLIGHIAAIRAVLAAAQYQTETIISESRRALKYLHPDNLAVRTATIWKMGIAYQLQGDRTAASQAYKEAISISQASGNTVIEIAATLGLGDLQESENQLSLATETYQHVLQLVGDPPQLAVCDARLGLAHISYQRNDLDAAEQHGQQNLQLAQQFGNMDRLVAGKVFLAQLKLAQGDLAGAVAMLAQADQLVRQYDLQHRVSELAATQVLTLLRKDNLEAADDLAQKHKLPISQARVSLARRDTSAALATLELLRQQVEATGYADERLRVMVLQTVALYVHGKKEEAVQLLGDALALAEPGGSIRIFVDEGPPMARLLYEAAIRGIAPGYVHQLLSAFPVTEPEQAGPPNVQTPESSLIEPLSERELEVLRLMADGLTNREIASRLFLALNTVKAHAGNIYGKLNVHSRTQAIARAQTLGLLPRE